jgi:5-methylcytosine-specific restriction protein A
MSGAASPRELWLAGQLTGGYERQRSFSIGPAPAPKTCRWCWLPVTCSKRSTWCSKACVDEYNELRDCFNPTVLRNKVEARDHGVCALCHVDTEWLKAQIWPKLPMAPVINQGWGTGEQGLQVAAAARDAAAEWQDQILDFARRVAARGILQNKFPWTFKADRFKDFWEMDHILPVVEGGGCTGLENLRTLCLGCHRSVTADLKGRLARKPKKGARG